MASQVRARCGGNYLGGPSYKRNEGGKKGEEKRAKTNSRMKTAKGRSCPKKGVVSPQENKLKEGKKVIREKPNRGKIVD